MDNLQALMEAKIYVHAASTMLDHAKLALCKIDDPDNRMLHSATLRTNELLYDLAAKVRAKTGTRNAITN